MKRIKDNDLLSGFMPGLDLIDEHKYDNMDKIKEIIIENFSDAKYFDL